jgi:hypothetical protein
LKRVRKLMLAAGALALSLSTPALSQTETAKQGPDADLRCAAWAAVAAGLSKDEPEAATAFAVTLAWFLARYEGATGKRFEEAMTPEYLNRLEPELPAIQAACLPRMQEMGERLSDWGAVLQNSGQ